MSTKYEPSIVLPSTLLLISDAPKTIFNAAVLSLHDDVTPLIVRWAVNLWIFTAHHRRWEGMAHERLQPPLYSPGFCHTSRCPNAALAYVLCNARCRSRHGVEVRETTRQGKVGLGLFACRQFSPDSFVVPLSWYVKTGRGFHNPSLSVQSLTVSTRWEQFQCRNRGGWNISYGSWRIGASKTETCRVGSACH